MTPYEQELAAIKKDLADLRANLLGKLSREILTLQAQKSALQEDIQRLQGQRRELEVQIVTQQGFERADMQRQQWIEQLAAAIAVYLRADLHAGNSRATKQYSDTFDKLMLDLDSTLRATFQTLQRDIDSYQKDLDNQMLRMHGQKLQGEMLLTAMVTRIDEQLRELAAPDKRHGYSHGAGQGNGNSVPPTETRLNINYFPATAAPTAPAPLQVDPWWRGFILVIAASVVLSLQNVLTRIVFRESAILGTVTFGGLLAPGFENALLTLLVRMFFAVPAMWLVATQLFGVDVLGDIRQLLLPQHRYYLRRVLFSSFLQFVAFTSIFVAIGRMEPALATTVFFIYPTITVLLSWLLFRQRPSYLSWSVIGIIYVGIILTLNVFGKQTDGLGIIYALVSGTSFAGYIVTSKACFKQVNTASFTAISFTVIFLLSLLFAPFCLGSWLAIDAGHLLPLTGICFLIALTTMGGYLFTNFGTSLMGPAQASIVSSVGPVMTTLLAFLILGDRLQISQVVGVLLVVVGVGLLGRHNAMKLINSKLPGRSENRSEFA